MNIENLSDSDIRIMEAQVTEKRKQDITHQQYLNELINNLNMLGENIFKNSV